MANPSVSVQSIVNNNAFRETLLDFAKTRAIPAPDESSFEWDAWNTAFADAFRAVIASADHYCAVRKPGAVRKRVDGRKWGGVTMADTFIPQSGDIVGKLLHDIGDYEIFQASLAAYARVAVDINAHHDEDSLPGAAVTALDASAIRLVAAAANYHCVHTLFDILTTLDAALRQSPDKEE